jgi:DNA sulfur modification protein DndD
LTKKKQELENEIQKLKDDYEEAINYANEHQEQYNQFKEGKNADDITREKMNKIGQSIKETVKQECEYRQDIDNLAKDLETKVIFLKLASMLKPEVDVILHAKEETKSQRANILSDEQIERFTRNLVQLIEERYTTSKNIDTLALINELKRQQEEGDDIEDKYDFLTHEEVMQLDKLVNSAIVNPLAELDEKRSRLNKEIQEMPRQQQQLKEYQQALNGSDYTIIELYEANSKNIQQLKDDIENKGKELLELGKKIATYDYDMPQVPDPQYDMLCKLPDFFKALSAQLLRAKKANIERMMRDQLNMNLVVYAGVIGRVELSADDSDEISFKIFHKNNNEIYLSQLNAGAKQTVMQVLLKVLYNLGDYEPPVMIDTVMGVLDKESREVILERYFPDLAHQTILLSTDTEITTDHDFEKIQAYVAKTYTLHRDKENQCTTISEDYFGLKTKEF